ncbi:MAG: hypothetical protein ACXAC7_21125 [Candidatus Hodarchaeales archaeon]
MWREKITNFWSKNTLYCLFLANPYCSDDAFGYYTFNELNKRSYQLPKTLKFFFSYNISVEELIESLIQDKEEIKAVLFIDTVINTEKKVNPIFNDESFNISNFSSHKAEWKIIKQLCEKNDFKLAFLLIPIKNSTFVGEIIPLSERLNKVKNELIEILSTR